MLGGSHSALSARKLMVRDWRGGELGVLLSALVLAVAVVVGVGDFVARLQTALETESLRFLAADRVITSRSAIPSAWIERARADGLTTADQLAFSSMIMTDDDVMYLASVKAVSPGYPLRGELQISAEPFGPLLVSHGVPEPGEVWLAPRLFSLLQVQPGDRVWVGEAGFTVAGAVRSEPDGASARFAYGPRLMMRLSDIEQTGVVQPGSRVTYRLLLRGEPAALEAFTEWVSPRLGQGQRLLGLEDNQPRIGGALERARGFLLLAGSLGVILAASAIALAARRFSERHIEYVAVMKSLGATAGRISGLYGRSLLLLGLVATAAGWVVGWGMQALFFTLFADQLGVAPGAGGPTPYITGAATSLVCLTFFAWPPLRRLAAVPPIRVLRPDVATPSGHKPRDYLLGSSAMVALMWWYSGDLLMTAGLLGGLVVTVGFGYLLARGILRTARRAGGAAGSIWRLALAGLARRRDMNAAQMVIFGIAIMLLLVITMVRTSLVDQWREQLPAGTPNYFLLNIAPDQRGALADFLAGEDMETQALYPMTRGRVVEVNGRALAETPDSPDEGRQREANFTYSESLPEANEILAGRWWTPGADRTEVSVEEEFAQSLGASLGDRLTLRIGSDSFHADITSLRRADWESMKPNFFMVFPPEVLEGFPATFMTSLYLPDERKTELNRIVRRFPTVTVIELDIILGEIRSIIDRVSEAIELVLVVILLAGALVLVAGVEASVDVRVRESALLRALGADRKLLLGALWIEFTALGVFAGCLAVLGAETAVWILETQVLDLVWQPQFGLWPLGPLLGGVFIGGLGVFSCRRAVQVPPLVVLREA